MKLRKPCEHKDDEYPEGHYEPHKVFIQESVFLWHYEDCPGGVFLPDDTLPLDREALVEALDFFEEETGEYTEVIKAAAEKYLALYDALSVREAE